MKYMDDIFSKLEEKGVKIDKEQKEKIIARLNEVINYEPKVGVFGKTGVGKSSLCNALFGTDVCPISDVEACTRNPQEVLINMGEKKGITLLDVPGVGENTDRDNEYSELYAELLPNLDLVLWILKADDRAMSTDELFYKNIVKPHIEQGKPFFFVLNQVDKIEPFREWNIEGNEPGPNQNLNIDKKISEVAKNFDIARSSVVPVSANEKYNLVTLVDEIIRALPKEQRVTLYKAVNNDYKSDSSDKFVKTSWLDIVKETVGNVVEAVVDKVSDAISWVADTFFSWWPW